MTPLYASKKNALKSLIHYLDINKDNIKTIEADWYYPLTSEQKKAKNSKYKLNGVSKITIEFKD